MRRDAALWSCGFRPFFLLAGAHAIAFPAIWLLVLGGLRWPTAPEDLIAWHGREMLVGFAGAAMAGFLLTAVPTFTARPAQRGLPLMALAIVWTVGRIAGLAGAGALGAAADVAFGLGLLVAVGRDIVLAGSRRNLVIVAIVTLWTGAVAGYHAGVAPGVALMHVELALVTLISGRITPTFTASWMRARGLGSLPKSHVALDLCALLGVVLAGVVDVAGTTGSAAGLAFGGVAAVHALRLSLWRGPATRGEPLLWSLHLAYLWVPVGYLLLAASAIAPDVVPRSSALHAMTIGAIGSMILAVMPRVTLGHTGRALRSTGAMAAAHLGLTAAALARVLATLGTGWHDTLLLVSGGTWIAGFGLFVLRHAPMLVAPRVDAGEPRSAPAPAHRDRADPPGHSSSSMER